MARGKSKEDRAQDQLEHLKGILPVDGEPSAPAPTRLDAAVEKSTKAAAAASSTRTRMAHRDEMEVWEKNPRRHRSRRQIRKVAKSMKADGQDEVLIVRQHPDPEKRAQGIFWQVITGGTRWEASGPEWADQPLLRIEVRDLSDKEALKLAWRNNKWRNEMGPLDDAYYYRELSKMEGDEDSDKTLRTVAAESGVSHTRVQQFKNLFKLPEEVLNAMMDSEGEDEDLDENGKEEKRVEWNEKHGRALVILTDYPDTQHRLFLEIKRDFLSGNGAIKRAEKLVTEAMEDAGIAPKPKKTRKPKPTVEEEKKEEQPAPPSEEKPTEEESVGQPQAQAGGEGAPPTGKPVSPTTPDTALAEDTTPDVPSDVTPGLSPPAPPAVAGVHGASFGGGGGGYVAPVTAPVVPTGVAESRFTPAVVAVEQLARDIEVSPLTEEEVRLVGFLFGRMKKGVERIGARIDQTKTGMI